MRADVSALILAGGRATRLGGVDKRTLVVEGATIFARQCAVLAPCVHEILVSAGTDVDGHRTVRDAVPGAGPLAGIAAGLAAAATPWLLVVAGDMPYLARELVELMLARIGDDRDAVGIRIGGLPEPLVCALRVAPARACVDRRLARGAYRASGLLVEEGMRVAWVEEAEVRGIDPELRVLRNVNEPGDL